MMDSWQSNCAGLEQFEDGRIKFACPLNPDHLVVGRPFGQRYRLRCLGDCPTDSVLEALGITQSDLIVGPVVNEPPPPPRRPPPQESPSLPPKVVADGFSGNSAGVVLDSPKLPPIDPFKVWQVRVSKIIEANCEQMGGLSFANTDPEKLFDSGTNYALSVIEQSGLYPQDRTDLEQEVRNIAIGTIQPYIDKYADVHVPATTDGNAVKTQWPEPREVAPNLLPVPTCVPEMLPASLRAWPVDIAQRLQCPLDFPAIGMLVSISAVIGRQITIRPKRRDDWTVVPNLWGGVVGIPSVLKSPALSEAMRPLGDLRRKAADVYREEIAAFEFNRVVRKARREEIKKALASGAQGGKRLEAGKLAELRREFEDAEAPEPIERRYLTSDTTVEKFGELLNENPRGMLIYRDELTGFLRGLERAGHEQDRAFYTECWNGYGSFDWDRIGRGHLHVAATCASILGGIQPDPLRSYLLATFAEGRNDGFIQRFQLLVYPDIAPAWENIDRDPDSAAYATATRVFQGLDEITPAAIGAVLENGQLPFVRFTEEAQDFFDEWRRDLEIRLRTGEESPVMVAHLAKYRSLMPSLALIYWLIDQAAAGFSGSSRGYSTSGKMVTLDAAGHAAAICDYLELHAQRIFQTVTQRHRAVAAALAKKIEGGKLANPFTARQVYINDWAELSNPEDVMNALEVLEEAAWVRLTELRNPTGGRPKIQVEINPKVLK